MTIVAHYLIFEQGLTDYDVTSIKLTQSSDRSWVRGSVALRSIRPCVVRVPG